MNHCKHVLKQSMLQVDPLRCSCQVHCVVHAMMNATCTSILRSCPAAVCAHLSRHACCYPYQRKTTHRNIEEDRQQGTTSVLCLQPSELTSFGASATVRTKQPTRNTSVRTHTIDKLACFAAFGVDKPRRERHRAHQEARIPTAPPVPTLHPPHDALCRGRLPPLHCDRGRAAQRLAARAAAAAAGMPPAERAHAGRQALS